MTENPFFHPDKEPALFLTEIFDSLQGETSFTGLPTTFIRLAGCNLRCRWCDTPYSFRKGKKQGFHTITQRLKPHYRLCITGGEPLLQPAIYLCMEKWCDLGYHLSLETGGSLSTEKVDPRVCVILDIKCPGSLENHKNCWENITRLRPSDEVKFVIADWEDFQWSIDICRHYQLFERAKPVLFSPVYGELPYPDLAQWILESGYAIRMNLQIHKIIWGGETRL